MSMLFEFCVSSVFSRLYVFLACNITRVRENPEKSDFRRDVDKEIINNLFRLFVISRINAAR